MQSDANPSPAKFPANREKYREFRESWAIQRGCHRCKRLILPDFSDQSPVCLLNRTGNFKGAYQGIQDAYKGIKFALKVGSENTAQPTRRMPYQSEHATNPSSDVNQPACRNSFILHAFLILANHTPAFNIRGPPISCMGTFQEKACKPRAPGYTSGEKTSGPGLSHQAGHYMNTRNFHCNSPYMSTSFSAPTNTCPSATVGTENFTASPAPSRPEF